MCETKLYKGVLMKKLIIAIFLGVFLHAGCATQNKHLLKIDSTPPDALISVHRTRYSPSRDIREVAGASPVEKNFDFPKSNCLWIEVEKRGYVSQMIEVTPDNKVLSITLERMKNENGENVKEYTFPKAQRVLLAMPDIKVIRRGFSKEKVSEQESRVARAAIAKEIRTVFAGKYEVSIIESSHEDEQLLKSLWRDVWTVMTLTDPIRLKYQQQTPYLETRSSREAARKLGLQYGAEVLLFISGKQNLETAGMIIGKMGICAAGTLNSYAGGYSRAVSRGDSTFVYTIHTPKVAQGTILKAVLINCSNGEILWVNKGVWGLIPFNDPDTVKKTTADLLSGLN